MVWENVNYRVGRYLLDYLLSWWHFKRHKMFLHVLNIYLIIWINKIAQFILLKLRPHLVRLLGTIHALSIEVLRWSHLYYSAYSGTKIMFSILRKWHMYSYIPYLYLDAVTIWTTIYNILESLIKTTYKTTNYLKTNMKCAPESYFYSDTHLHVCDYVSNFNILHFSDQW